MCYIYINDTTDSQLRSYSTLSTLLIADAVYSINHDESPIETFSVLPSVGSDDTVPNVILDYYASWASVRLNPFGKISGFGCREVSNRESILPVDASNHSMKNNAERGKLTPSTENCLRCQVLIIGGGTAGITVAAQLRRKGIQNVAIIEPSTKHYYQPLWTLVGAGAAKAEQSVREEKHYIPRGTIWIRDSAEEIDPERKFVVTRNATLVHYDFLVVAPGIVSDWQKIAGATETLGQNGVSSNYEFDLTTKTWQFMQQTHEGIALFTTPNTAEPGYTVKCGGAPQKIAYLAADYFRRQKRPVKVIFATPSASLFPVPQFRSVLENVCSRYGIEILTQHELIAVDPKKREATFALKDQPTATRTIPYQMLHIAPPQRPADFIRRSPLAYSDGQRMGFVEVDIHTLQHTRYPNVFAIGDAAGLPTARTGAAVRKQAPVVVHNLMQVMQGKEPDKHYNGYTSCPLVTGYGRMLLAEFDYDDNPTPSIPLLNVFKERYDMWLLKKYGLPWMYWNLMLRGLA